MSPTGFEALESAFTCGTPPDERRLMSELLALCQARGHALDAEDLRHMQTACRLALRCLAGLRSPEQRSFSA